MFHAHEDETQEILSIQDKNVFQICSKQGKQDTSKVLRVAGGDQGGGG